MNSKKSVIDFLRSYIGRSRSIPVVLDLKKIQNAKKRLAEGFDSIGNCLDEVQGLTEYKESLTQKLTDLENEVREGKNGAEIDINNATVRNYCDAYYSVLKNVIFSKDNRNLRNDDFRQSLLLENLTTLFAEKKDENYRFDILEPFICQAIIDAASFKKSFIKADKLFELRREMFLESVESTLNRFLNIQQKRFKLNYRKKSVGFLAVPYERLSSVCSIDPMRIYEHIISYIESMEEIRSAYDQLTVKVCIIGELEDDNYSLEDLCKAVSRWYERLEVATKLLLQIKQIVNYQFDSNKKSDEIKLDSKPGNTGAAADYYCSVVGMDYKKQFTYSTKKLMEIVADNEITFVVDCPWLYREESKTGFESELASQIENLSDRRERNDTELYANFGTYHKGTAAGRMGSMLYDMMESPKMINGKIEKFLKNNVISDIISYVKSADKGRKEVFVICSDYHAYRYSDAFVYLLTKNEKYDGKDYSVIKFTNTPAKTLAKPKGGKTEIVIDLWSILKYLSMTYYRRCFEKIVRACVKSNREKISSEEILEISKGIKVRLRIEHIHNVEVSIEIDNFARKLLWQYDNADTVRIKKADCERIASMIYELSRAAFTNNREYADDAIKTCFEINMYNNAKNVMDMLFINRYRYAMNRGPNYYFDVQYAGYIDIMEQDDCRIGLTDRFMDKKIYSFLLSSAEQTADQNIYLELLCNNENGLLPKKTEKKIQYYIENALAACEKAKETDTELYHNLQKMLVVERI